MIDIIDALNIPKRGIIKQKVFMKEVLKQMNATSHDKKIFTNDVKSIFLVGIIDTETIRIPSYIDEDYRYETIYIFEVLLKSISNFTKINERVHSVFPNPIVIIYKFGETNILSTALKRINKIYNEKSVIEDIYVSNSFIYEDKHKPFYEALNIQKISALNLKQLYEKINDIIYAEKLIELIGFYPANFINAFEIKKEIKQIESYLSSIKTNEDKYKNEQMMKDKMELHIKIQKDKQSIEDIIKKIKEDINYE